jgi:hypothetical protein
MVNNKKMVNLGPKIPPPPPPPQSPNCPKTSNEEYDSLSQTTVEIPYVPAVTHYSCYVFYVYCFHDSPVTVLSESTVFYFSCLFFSVIHTLPPSLPPPHPPTSPPAHSLASCPVSLAFFILVSSSNSATAEYPAVTTKYAPI